LNATAVRTHELRSTVAFSAAAGALLLLSVAAFSKPYFSHPISITEPYVHTHVFFVALWLSALIAQPLLIRARNTAASSRNTAAR
jgi:hypothetical protein